MTQLSQVWEAFCAERAVTLQATSLSTDYRQVGQWLSRCPVQDMERGREAMGWVLTQNPPKSARKVAMFLKSLYRWAASEDVALVARNPVASYAFPKRPQSEDEVVVIPRVEVPLLIAGLEPVRKRGAQWHLLAQWMLQTGVRTGEAFATQWSDVRSERVLVHQNYTLSHGLKASTKTNKRRWVPLNTVARGTLEELPRTSAFVFPWDRQAFQSFFARRVEQLVGQGVLNRRYRPYDLRHTAISGWLEAGIPVTQTASWAGNSAQVIWQHYANTTGDYEMPVL